MIILTLRTDKPEAEIGLYDDQKQIAYESWQAHRQLAETIHTKIADLLKQHGFDWNSIDGTVVYEGPGSFTGLRVGLSVANALAASLEIPITGAQGNAWIASGAGKLLKGQNDRVVLPFYGADPHITQPKK